MTVDETHEWAPVAGALIAGKYRVEKVLGEGGMGLVLVASHEELGHRVAVKILKPEVLGNDEARQRFLREARAMVSLRSTNIARVYDVGKLDNGIPFMVMEFLEGTDLANLVEQQGVLNADEAASYVLQACDAISEAHDKGIVHRDLKPANLFLTRRTGGAPLVKVLDFGISKATQGEGAALNLTATATMIGSPHYMSPEQIRSSRSVDTRADIWSLGVILFELVTGKHPFSGDTLASLCAAIVIDAPKPLLGLRPDLDHEFVRVVLRCLEKDSARRYQTVGALMEALAAFAGPHAPDDRASMRRVVAARGGEQTGVETGDMPAAFSGAALGVVPPAAPSQSVRTAAQTPRALAREASSTASAVGGTNDKVSGNKRALLFAGGGTIVVALLLFGAIRHEEANRSQIATSGASADTSAVASASARTSEVAAGSVAIPSALPAAGVTPSASATAVSTKPTLHATRPTPSARATASQKGPAPSLLDSLDRK